MKEHRPKIQGIFEAFYADRFSRTFYDEMTIWDEEGNPEYEVTSVVSIRKLKMQKTIPKKIEVNMSIDNNATNIQITKEAETDKRKPRIISEVTIRPADTKQNKKNSAIISSKEMNKSDEEEIMFLSEHEMQKEEKQNLTNQIKTWRKNNTMNNENFVFDK